MKCHPLFCLAFSLTSLVLPPLQASQTHSLSRRQEKSSKQPCEGKERTLSTRNHSHQTKAILGQLNYILASVGGVAQTFQEQIQSFAKDEKVSHEQRQRALDGIHLHVQPALAEIDHIFTEFQDLLRTVCDVPRLSLLQDAEVIQAFGRLQPTLHRVLQGTLQYYETGFESSDVGKWLQDVVWRHQTLREELDHIEQLFSTHSHQEQQT